MTGVLARMSVGARIFAALALWFAGLTVVYTVVAYGEWAGTVLLLLSAALSGFVAVELTRDPADIEAGDDGHDGPVPAAEAVDEPPTSSLPSFLTAAGIVVTAAGLPLGVWIILPGAVMVIGGLVGMIDESARS